MKKLVIVFLLAFITIIPQQNKGKISLTFNGEVIELPINTINIRKDNKFLISVRAEQNDSISQKMISLELGFRKLSSDDKKGLEPYETRLQISSRNNVEYSGKELFLNLSNDGEGRFSVFKKGERVTWEITQLSMKFSVTEISLENDELKIVGNFSGTFRSMLDGTLRKDFAEIKDGKFEIIL
ncbi:MAG: hypothetical protein WC209_08125 [Ignavibacteriaceae bacterium]|jgi:hypothetical protein